MTSKCGTLTNVVKRELCDLSRGLRDGVGNDVPLMDAGLDSLAATELVSTGGDETGEKGGVQLVVADGEPGSMG